MRHSFAGYHLALHMSADKTAFELGHRDSKMLFERTANSYQQKKHENIGKFALKMDTEYHSNQSLITKYSIKIQKI